MKYLLHLLGFTQRKPSLLLMHMCDVTHGTWLQDLNRTNRLSDYNVKK
jgi:hypothetical protein